MTRQAIRLAAPAALALALVLSSCTGGGQAGPAVALKTLADHAANFPIAAGEAHGPATGTTWPDCFACHADLSSGARQLPSSLKVFTCTGCHVITVGGFDHADPAAVAAAHAAVAEFAAAVAPPGNLDRACHGCHRDGKASAPADHGRRFPLPHPGTAAGSSQASCAACHLDPLHRSDVTTLGCASCHDQRPGFATAHAGVASFGDAAAACVRCHPAGEHLQVATHAPFLLAPTAISSTVKHLATSRASGDCFTCHPTQGTAETATAVAKAWAQDFTTTSCVACHVAVGHATSTTADHGDQAGLATLHVANGGVATTAAFDAAVTTAGSLSAACLQCHGGGTGDAAPADHATWFPIGAASKHVGIGCNQCHTNPANRKDLTAFACASCHAQDTSPTLAAGHTVSGYAITSYQAATTAGGTQTTRQVDMASSQNCLRCHGDGQVDRVSSHNQSNPGFGTGRHKTGGCFTCHFTLRTDKTYALAFTTPPQNVDSAGPPPVGCYVCHSSGTGN